MVLWQGIVHSSRGFLDGSWQGIVHSRGSKGIVIASVQEFVVLGCSVVLQGAGVSRRIVTVSSCQGCCTCNNGFKILGRDFQGFVVLRDSIFLSGLLLLQQRIRGSARFLS